MCRHRKTIVEFQRVYIVVQKYPRYNLIELSNVTIPWEVMVIGVLRCTDIPTNIGIFISDIRLSKWTSQYISSL